MQIKIHNPLYIRFLIQHVCILYVIKNKMPRYRFQLYSFICNYLIISREKYNYFLYIII